MSYRTGSGGSGTLAVDEYRSTMGQAAAHCLDNGLGANCLSADHLSGSELCVEAIVRKAADSAKSAKWFDGTPKGMGASQKAANNLRAGIGVHKAQADHSANTCADVIAAAV
jgi:hypothetical protein